MFGAAKDQRPLALVFGQQLFQQLCLLGLGDEVHLLRHLVRRLARRRDFDANRAVEIAVGDLIHQLGHGCREQHRLALFRDQVRDFAQVMDKAHVEHLVGFIQHKEGRRVELDRTAIQKVQQTARCGDQQIDTAFQTLDLRVDRLAADNHRHFNLRAFSIAAQVHGDLLRQLAGWGQDQTAHRTRLGAAFKLHHLRQKRHTKSRRFTSAGLGKAHHVTAIHGLGDRLALDRGWIFQTHFIQPGNQFLWQAHHVKIAHSFTFRQAPRGRASQIAGVGHMPHTRLLRLAPRVILGTSAGLVDSIQWPLVGLGADTAHAAEGFA